MLALFRRSQKIWLWGLIVVVVVTFVFSFVPGMRMGGLRMGTLARTMGLYNQKKVTEQDLKRAVAGAIIDLRLQGRTAEELNDPRQMEREAWMRIMMVSEAKAAGIATSPQELERFVRNNFFKGQPINQDYYRSIIQNLGGLGMSPREFEDHLSDTLLVGKLRQSFGQTAFVSDEEVRQMYEAQRTLIKLAYISFNYSNYFPQALITTNEAAAYYTANQKTFTVPPQADIIVALVRPKIAGIVLDPAQIEEYYDQHKSLFVVTNVTHDAADTNATRGTEEITYKPLSAVSNMIASLLVSNEANNIAFDTATSLCDAMTSVDAEKEKDRAKLFLDSAAKLKIPTVRSGLLSQQDSVPDITNSAALVAMAFAMKVGELSDPRTIPDVGHAVVYVKEKNDAFLPELASIMTKVKNELRLELALSNTYVAASIAKAQMGMQATSFTNAAAQLKLKVKVTLPFDRATGTTELGCPPQVISRLFAFPANIPIVIPCQSGYALACTVEIIEPDYGLMKNSARTIKEQLTYQHHVLLFQMWLNQNQQKKLKISQSMIQQDQAAPEGDTGTTDGY